MLTALNGRDVIATDTASGEILDNDSAVFTVDDVTVNEADGTATFTIAVTNPSDIPIDIDVSYADVTAVGGNVDYDSATDTATFAAGSDASQQVVVAINNDNLLETTETFSVALASSTVLGGRVIDTTDGALGTITDNETATVRFVQPGSSALEQAPTLPVEVRLDTNGATLAVPVSVDVIDLLGGSAVAGTDYSYLTPQTVTFNIGDGDGTVKPTTLTPSDDLLLEGNETVNLQLQNVVTSGQAALGATTDHTVTIIDDESATVRFSQPASSALEQAPTLPVEVRLETGGATLAVPISVDVADLLTGSAQAAGVDYSFASQTVTFNVGEGDGTVKPTSLTLADDLLLEGDETVNLELTGLVALATVSVAVGTPDAHQVTIIDNESVQVQFVTSGSSVAEATVGHPVQLQLTGAAGVTLAPGVTVTADVIDAAGGSATGGTDYSAFGTQVLTFTAGAIVGDTADVTLGVLGDNVVELDETVDLQINAASGPSASVGAGDTHQATITNDDSATLFFTNDPVFVSESDTGATAFFNVRLSNDVDTGVDVAYTTNDGTATLADNDYLLSSGTLNFAGNANETISIVVNIVGDTNVEANEDYLVDLLTIAAGGRDVTFAENQAQGFIVADDLATVTVTGASEVEENGVLNLQVALSDPVDATVDVDLSTVDIGDATGGIDYTSITNQLVSFPAGSTTPVTVPVTILDENIVEADEVFEAALSNLVSSLGVFLSLGPNATSTIENTDTATVNVSGVSDSEQNGPFNLQVSLSAPVDAAVTVDLSTVDVGSAAGGGVDYSDLVGQVVNLPANSTAAVGVPVTITDDNTVEAAETFQATLSNLGGSLSGNLSLGPDATSTILDTDTAVITIDDVSVNEGDGTATFDVSISDPVDIPVVIDVNYSDISTDANDFDHAADQVTFAANSHSHAIGHGFAER